MAEPEGRIAVLAGASGFVGGHLLDALLDSREFGRVYAITRRPLGREHARLANRIVQFERLESQLKGMRCDYAFCCIGATPREARSEQALRQIELGFVPSFARAARAAQAQRFVLLSRAGADPHSRNSLLRAKGEAEQALGALGFASLDILQPGPLLGLRRELSLSDLLRNLVMPAVNPLLVGAREPYRGIAAREVASAMLGAARSGRRGVYRYTYGGIRGLAQPRRPVRAAQEV
jgi:uncharacterized protein YbjT (DUF2867 family)